MVAYVYADSNAPVDAYTFGRCDRESNCQYHYHPSDDKAFTPDHTIMPVQPPIIEQIFPTKEIIERLTERTKTCTSNLHAYMRTLGISNDHILKWGVYSEDNDKTAFLIKDTNDQVCNIKWFAYSADGHRSKDINAHSLRQPKESSSPPTPPNQKKSSERKIAKKYLLPLFGAHLLDKSKKKTVCLVESEKTAVMASFFYKDFDWVSCGSANGLGVGEGIPGDHKVKDLFGRKIYWLADADKAGRKNKSLDILKSYEQDVTIIDLHPELDNGQDLGDDIDAGVRPEIKPAAATDRKFDDDYLDLKLPDGVEFDNVKWDIFKYNHIIHDKKILMVRTAKNKRSMFLEKITNFSIKPLGLILSRTNPRRLLVLKNIFGEEDVVEVPTKAFIQQNEFAGFVEGKGNYQYDGVGTDLKKIRAKLYDDMLNFEEITTLGWHYNGYFIWANGVYDGKFKPINKYGFVKMGKTNYYIPPLSCLIKTDEEKVEWEDERKFVYAERKDVTLKKWAELYCRVHKENGIISQAWFISALFRDFIYKEFKFFPHWFGFGPPGTGKSQVGWSLRAMFFNARKTPFPFGGGTSVAFHREFSHFINGITWMDEYKNNTDPERIKSAKGAYDGVGHKKSMKDSDTRSKAIPINSAAMFTGQELPTADNALFQRNILSQFFQTSYTKEEEVIYKELIDMENDGLSCITAKLMHLRKKVEGHFMSTFEWVLADFYKHVVEDVDDRIMRNMCITATTIRLMDKYMPNTLPYDYEAYRQIAINNVLEQVALISNANETHQFWGMVSFLIDQGLIAEDKDYRFRDASRISVTVKNKNVTIPFEEIKKIMYVRLGRIVPLYREHFKRQNSVTSSPLDQESLKHYLRHQKYYIGAVGNVKFGAAQGSAHAFDYGMMESMGFELRRGALDTNAPEDGAEVGDDKEKAKF